MIDQELRTNLVEVLETGAFKTEHSFQSGLGVLGSLTLNVGKTQGTFRSDHQPLQTFEKPSPWKSVYAWREGGTLIGRAASRKAMSRSLGVEFQGASYGLMPGGSKFRSWRLLNSSHQVLCEILPRGAFKRGARIRIKAEIPVGLLAFAYCLVNKRWQEESG